MEKQMRYRVGPLNKKSVTEVERWSKDGEELVHRIGWRWGYVLMDEKPDLSEYDPETQEIEVYSEWDCELDSCDDGCWEEWEYPESWTEEEQGDFHEAWDLQWHEAPTNMGFTEEDSELWFSGELEITEVED